MPQNPQPHSPQPSCHHYHNQATSKASPPSREFGREWPDLTREVWVFRERSLSFFKRELMKPSQQRSMTHGYRCLQGGGGGDKRQRKGKSENERERRENEEVRREKGREWSWRERERWDIFIKIIIFFSIFDLRAIGLLSRSLFGLFGDGFKWLIKKR